MPHKKRYQKSSSASETSDWCFRKTGEESPPHPQPEIVPTQRAARMMGSSGERYNLVRPGEDRCPAAPQQPSGGRVPAAEPSGVGPAVRGGACVVAAERCWPGAIAAHRGRTAGRTRDARERLPQTLPRPRRHSAALPPLSGAGRAPSTRSAAAVSVGHDACPTPPPGTGQLSGGAGRARAGAGGMVRGKAAARLLNARWGSCGPQRVARRRLCGCSGTSGAVSLPTPKHHTTVF